MGPKETKDSDNKRINQGGTVKGLSQSAKIGILQLKYYASKVLDARKVIN